MSKGGKRASIPTNVKIEIRLSFNCCMGGN